MQKMRHNIHNFEEHHLIMVDGVEDKEASRRFKIKFQLKNSQILGNIKSMTND